MMVNVKAPVWAVGIVFTVNVDVPDPLTLGGLKLPLAPAPNPVTLSVTFPGDPFKPTTEVE
jgi:hypothetical protein